MSSHAETLARFALKVEAVIFRPNEPFTWASGYKMPIYNDNRRLLSAFRYRKAVCEGFCSLIEKHQLEVDAIAGTATAGVAPATTLADRLELPLLYVRDKAKGHGMENLVEGVLTEGTNVLVIEDVVSTGGSSARAVAGIQDAGGVVTHCLSIFSYGFAKADDAFSKQECSHLSIFTINDLLQCAKQENFLAEEEIKELERWRESPFTWAESR